MITVSTLDAGAGSPPLHFFRFASPAGDFESGKVGCTFAGTAMQLALFPLLESEPNVVAYEPNRDGTVEVRYWYGKILAQVLPASGLARAEALRTKADHARAGRRVISIPEARMRRFPDRENRAIVAGAGRRTISITERAAIVDSLLEAGGTAPLGDLACHVRSTDPVAGVLSLVSRCVLKIDLSTRPIDSRTPVSLFDLPSAGD